MIPNKTKASAYRVRTLDRNDLNEKGKIFIGQGGTSTVDGVEGVFSNVTAENIIDAINNNQTNAKYVQLKDKENLKNYLLDFIYPVGSIYITTALISPEVFLGGKWEVFGQGRTLVGVDPQDKTGKYTATEKTGGEETHTLTAGEIPLYDYIEKVVPPDLGDPSFKSIKACSSQTSQPHNNMQPYITVYMYKRIA